tara:strand:- start:870 stop:1700 length:831 start_codon:yes stop_codon:yes gene_type:complete
MDSPRFKSTIGFIDLLFNILLGFAFLFIVAFLLIKPEAKKQDFERRAEFVVILEWDHDMPDDIDLYVQDPTGNKVSFRTPIMNFMHLDKDDLGYRNDIVYNANGQITKVNINREVVTIRGLIAGEYIINAHYYSTREAEATISSLSGERRGDSEIISAARHGVGKPNKDKVLTVKIELHKVTPYQILWIGERLFDHRGQEDTFVRFTIDSEGNLIGGFSHVQKKFVVPNFGSGHLGVGANAYESESGDRVDHDTGANGNGAPVERELRDPAERDIP